MRNACKSCVLNFKVRDHLGDVGGKIILKQMLYMKGMYWTQVAKDMVLLNMVISSKFHKSREFPNHLSFQERPGTIQLLTWEIIHVPSRASCSTYVLP
jgi:hypothetical protein